MELDCNALLERAGTLIKQGKNLNEAKTILSALLTDYFDNPDLNYHLIAMLSDLELKAGNIGLGMALINQALVLRPDYFPALNNLGFVYKNLGQNDKSREAFLKVVEYMEGDAYQVPDTDKAFYFTNLAGSYTACGTPAKALEVADKALSFDPDNSHAKWNKGLAYLEMGNYVDGFENFEYGQRIESEKNRNYARDELPFWDGTPGKNVVVFGEQGIGDEIMFASMLPDLMRDCSSVVLDAHIRLKDMFHHSFPNLSIYGTREGPDVPWAKYESIDAKIRMGSLGKFYRKKTEDFPGTPYLKADPKWIEHYKEKLQALSDRPKIGLSWQGGLVRTNKCYRKIPLETLLPLFDCDVDFISLQYNKDIGPKVTEFEQNHGVKLHHWQDVLDDYDETAGLVCNMDLIISVPQSVVHLAGALGVNTIQLCPKRALWQMGPYGQDMPWYSCVTNIWQDETETWEPVINKAKEALCHLLQSSTES